MYNYQLAFERYEEICGYSIDSLYSDSSNGFSFDMVILNGEPVYFQSHDNGYCHCEIITEDDKIVEFYQGFGLLDEIEQALADYLEHGLSWHELCLAEEGSLAI